MANSKLNIQEYEDSQLANKYTAVTTADWLTMKGGNASIDIIVDSADPNGSTNYDAANIGSLYIKSDNGAWYRKTSATVWTVVA